MRKAHSKTHRGRLGLWVLLHFRLALASRALQVHVLFPEPPERKKWLACAGRLPHANYSVPIIGPYGTRGIPSALLETHPKFQTGVLPS